MVYPKGSPAANSSIDYTQMGPLRHPTVHTTFGDGPPPSPPSKKSQICTEPTAWIYLLKSKNKLILYSWVLEMLMVRVVKYVSSCHYQATYWWNFTGFLNLSRQKPGTKTSNYLIEKLCHYLFGTTEGNHGKSQVNRYHFTDTCLCRHTRLLLPKYTAFQKYLLQRIKL
jgi:hypothetical protein